MNNNDNKSFLWLVTSLFCIVILVAGCASQPSSGQLSSTPVAEEYENTLVENMPVSQPAEDVNVATTLSAQQGDTATLMPEDGEQGVAWVQQPEFDHDDVIWIQQRLKDLGYYNGSVDGVVGQVTRGAIKDYQRDQAVTANGVPSAELREFMWRNGG